MGWGMEGCLGMVGGNGGKKVDKEEEVVPQPLSWRWREKEGRIEEGMRGM